MRVETEKWDRLIELFSRMGRAAVAFSAGVDSTLLLKAAHEALGVDVIAITGRSISFPERENREAESFCRSMGIKHITVDIDQMAVPGFAENTPERCYYCKKELFTAFINAAGENGFSQIAEGSNIDDLSDYRPGMRAVRELGVRSPLQEVGLTKREIRELSEMLGLPTWSKPPFACLATRFPYGVRITAEKLDAVGKAEQLLLDLGFRLVRVRAHGDIARIEIDREQILRIVEPEISNMIIKELRDLGFLYVALELGGYQTGSMNRPLIP